MIVSPEGAEKDRKVLPSELQTSHVLAVWPRVGPRTHTSPVPAMIMRVAPGNTSGAYTSRRTTARRVAASAPTPGEEAIAWILVSSTLSKLDRGSGMGVPSLRRVQAVPAPT